MSNVVDLAAFRHPQSRQTERQQIRDCLDIANAPVVIVGTPRPSLRKLFAKLRWSAAANPVAERDGETFRYQRCDHQHWLINKRIGQRVDITEDAAKRFLESLLFGCEKGGAANLERFPT
jgi:hypothetical protein